jgi:hypothetical protein
MKTFGLTALGMLLLTAAAAGEEARPDFSGTWVLDLERSRLETAAPTRSTFWIEHRGGTFQLSRTHARDGRWNTISFELPIDGEEHYRKTGFSESWSRMTWLGDELVLDMKIAHGEVRGTNVVHYRLTDEGETLVAAEWAHAPHRQHHNLWVLERVPDDRADEHRDRLKELAERYTAAWGSGDPAAVAAFFSPEGSLRVNDGEPAIGRDAIAAIVREYMTALPDLVLHFNGLEGSGERVDFHWTLEATHSGPGGTGHEILVSGYESWKLDEDGLIAESQGHFPSAEYERQLEVGWEEPPLSE